MQIHKPRNGHKSSIDLWQSQDQALYYLENLNWNHLKSRVCPFPPPEIYDYFVKGCNVDVERLDG